MGNEKDKSKKESTSKARQPIYTNNPKDPRLLNYRDSLDAYNAGQYNLAKLKEAGFKQDGEVWDDKKWREYLSQSTEFLNDYTYAKGQYYDTSPVQYSLPSSTSVTGYDLHYTQLKGAPDEFNLEREDPYINIPNRRVPLSTSASTSYITGEYNRSRNTKTKNGKLISDTGWIVDKDTRKKITEDRSTRGLLPLYEKPKQEVIYRARPVLPEVSRLPSKKVGLNTQTDSIHGEIQPVSPNHNYEPEGHYRVIRPHTYGEPQYQVWTPGNKWQNVTQEEYDKVSGNKHLTEYKNGGTMKRNKYMAGGVVKIVTAGMQANQAVVQGINAIGSNIIGDPSMEQQIKMDAMNKYGSLGLAGMPLAVIDATKGIKEYQRDKAQQIQEASLGYSERARAGYEMGGTLTHYEGLPHELGGIPIGTQHEVEHGETSYPAPDGQRVFSDTLKEGKRTFAQLSKKIEKDADMRPTDKVAQAIKEKRLNKLFARQEMQKLLKEEMLSTKEGSKAYGVMRKGGRIQHDGTDPLSDMLLPNDPTLYTMDPEQTVPSINLEDPFSTPISPTTETGWMPSLGRKTSYLDRTQVDPTYKQPNSLPMQYAKINGMPATNSPTWETSPWEDKLQRQEGYDASEPNPVENATGITKEDIRDMLGIDEKYATMGQLSQLLGPVSQFAITAADKDKMRFKRMGNVQLDKTTAPTIYKTQLREQAAAARQAIRRSTGNVGQYIGAVLALGKKEVEGAKGAAMIRAELDNKQAAMDFQREGANTEIANKELSYNQALRNMRRNNYIKALEGAGTRTAGIVKDDIAYETDLGMEAIKLGALGGMYHDVEVVTGPDGKKYLQVKRIK